MKHSIFKKLPLMFALVIIVQNGAIMIPNTDADQGSRLDHGKVSIYSDRPYSNDNWS